MILDFSEQLGTVPITQFCPPKPSAPLNCQMLMTNKMKHLLLPQYGIEPLFSRITWFTNYLGIGSKLDWDNTWSCLKAPMPGSHTQWLLIYYQWTHWLPVPMTLMHSTVWEPLRGPKLPTHWINAFRQKLSTSELLTCMMDEGDSWPGESVNGKNLHISFSQQTVALPCPVILLELQLRGCQWSEQRVCRVAGRSGTC